MVISPTLDFSRAISSSRSSRSRSFKAVAARLQARDRATRLAWRWRHSFPGPPGPAARRATVARRSRSFAERKSASDHSRRRPKGHLRQLWGSAPAPLRACALHHSSCLTLRLRFNLPQPGVSIIRAAPHAQALASEVELSRCYSLVLEQLAGTIHCNETSGEPSPRAAEKIFAWIDAARAPPRRLKSAP